MVIQDFPVWMEDPGRMVGRVPKATLLHLTDLDTCSLEIPVGTAFRVSAVISERRESRVLLEMWQICSICKRREILGFPGFVVKKVHLESLAILDWRETRASLDPRVRGVLQVSAHLDQKVSRATLAWWATKVSAVLGVNQV